MKLSVRRLVKVLLSIVILTFFTFSFSHNDTSQADELSQLEEEIAIKNKEKAEIEQNIKNIESSIATLTESSNEIEEKLNAVKDEKIKLEGEVGKLESKLTEISTLLGSYEEQLKVKEKDIIANTNLLFKLSYSSRSQILSNQQDLEGVVEDSTRTSVAVDLFKAEVKDYKDKIKKTSSQIEAVKKDKEDIATILKETQEKLASLQAEFDQQKLAMNNASSTADNYRKDLNNLNSELKFLSQRQQQLQSQEKNKMENNQQISQTEIKDGEYYFAGRGRDLVEGHGLGMSQWGAFGMAQKGWNYEKILKFYYSGVQITNYNEPDYVKVTGVTDYIPFDDYLSGIGEVPNSWPAEAIKAQVVAARTYVMGVCGNRTHCEICGTASCQVYLGGDAKRQYVNETKGKVITHGGSPIVAFYSASHRGHSSSLNAVWGGSDRPYIQPVNDDPYAYKDYQSCNPYVSGCQLIKTYNWKWRTNGYSLNQLTEIFNRDSRLSVGTVRRIDVQNDVSGRVSRITIVGDAGEKSMTGWDFKAIFNTATPYNDYVYSTEFTFHQK